MTTLAPKDYQEPPLASVGEYFRACREDGDAKTAFHQTMLRRWREPGSYKPIAGLDEGMPYFCLRVPTGGGKTLIGARGVPLANR